MTEEQIDERTLSVCAEMIAAGLDPRFLQRLWNDRRVAVDALRQIELWKAEKGITISEATLVSIAEQALEQVSR